MKLRRSLSERLLSHPSSSLLFANCTPIQVHKISQKKGLDSIGFTDTAWRVRCKRPECKRPELALMSITAPIVITFVTGNANKAREVSQILESGNGPESEHRFKVVSRKIDLPELQGEPDQIAREKCIFATKQIDGPTVSAQEQVIFSASIISSVC